MPPWCSKSTGWPAVIEASKSKATDKEGLVCPALDCFPGPAGLFAMWL